MASPPRILLVTGADPSATDRLAQLAPGDRLVRAADLPHALDLLAREPFDGVLADPAALGLDQSPGPLPRVSRVLDALEDGVALLDEEGRVVSANPAFRAWCAGDPAGRPLAEALAGEFLSPDPAPWRTARSGQPADARVRLRTGGEVVLRVTPVYDPAGRVRQLIALGRPAEGAPGERQKLEALHQAGRELSGLAPEQLADMSVEERKELLKLNLRRTIHDLLHYDVIEIRLLDRATGRLEPLLAEGMTPDAAGRELRASESGNGVTGLVAATGRSYLCPDTALDPHYIEGAAGARSSLTVPLIVQDQVIGTFNVESPRPSAFTPEDLQFTELFSREIAQALHTLELLSAQQLCSTSQSVDAINREIALPVDEVLAAATSLLARHRDPGDDEQLRRIIASARGIKEAVQRMGEGLTPSAPEGNQPSRLKGMRVLVVDAEERTRRLAHTILDRFGCVVETARTGQEAIDLASVHPYDAILTDIRLPDLSGYEAFRRLREARPGARIILMTGFAYDSEHAIIKSRQDGLRFVVFKPFRLDQLLEALLSPDKPAPPPPSETQPEVIQAS
jgi:CheY-like chemotaxis protein/PAS domain-containing protein